MLGARYVFSIYWSITTLATVGYGDVSACNTGEAIWSSIFMFVNLALSAYILGTITLLVVKSDEKAGEYREQSNSMKQYGALNDLPQVRVLCAAVLHLLAADACIRACVQSHEHESPDHCNMACSEDGQGDRILSRCSKAVQNLP